MKAPRTHSRRILRAKIVGSLFLACVSTGVGARDWPEVTIADAHLHLVDFLQSGDYLKHGELVRKVPGAALPSGQRGRRIEALLWAMDRANVSHALVTGMPFFKKWSEHDPSRPAYYLDSGSRVVRARDTDYHVALAIVDYALTAGETGRAQLARLSPCVSGFDPTDLGAVDMIAKRIKEFPGLFKCIGEVMSKHDDLTNLSTGEEPRANHPALFRIFDFAGEHGIPISIHHNIAPISPGPELREPAYLPEILSAFEAFPGTTFIWCHAGISRRVRVANLPAHLDALLLEHGDHVLIDLSWVVVPEYVNKDIEGWAALIRNHPDSFLLGSDAVGSFGDYPSEIRVYDRLFEAIGDREVIEKLASANYLRIVRKEGVVLDPDYLYPEDRYPAGSSR